MPARLLISVAIILTLASGYLSWQTRSKVNGLKGDVADAQTKASTAEAKVVDATKAAKEAKETAEAATKDKVTAEENLATAKHDVDSAKAALDAAKAEADSKQKEIDTLKSQIASAPTPAPNAVDPAQVDEMKKQLAEAQAKMSEQAQIVETLTKTKAEAEQKSKAFEDAENRRKTMLSMPGLEGKVLAVNPSWNFVVLNVGDRNGIVMNSELVVKRGGYAVAKLRVTSVEPATSIADILPGSVPKGKYVQPGDVAIVPSPKG